MSHHSVIVDRQIRKFGKCHKRFDASDKRFEQSPSNKYQPSFLYFLIFCVFYFILIFLYNFVFNLSVNIFAYIFLH